MPSINNLSAKILNQSLIKKYSSKCSSRVTAVIYDESYETSKKCNHLGGCEMNQTFHFDHVVE